MFIDEKVKPAVDAACTLISTLNMEGKTVLEKSLIVKGVNYTLNDALRVIATKMWRKNPTDFEATELYADGLINHGEYILRNCNTDDVLSGMLMIDQWCVMHHPKMECGVAIPPFGLVCCIDDDIT